MFGEVINYHNSRFAAECASKRIGNKKTLLSQGNRAMPQLFFSV